MKHRTLVTTQYLENYGAHSENGKFAEGHAYWKFKGGTMYVISSNEERPANAVAFLSAYLQKDFAEGHAYWKFKGGTMYVISSNEERPANAVAFLSAYLQKDNDSTYGKELPVSWERIEPDWKPEHSWEDWVELDVEEHFDKKSG